MPNQRRAAGAVTLLILCFVDHAALAEGGVRFHDVAPEPGSGIAFERVPSARNAIFDALKQEPFFIFPDDAARAPHKPRGAPGVAIFDYDRDGDLDLYVTNGPGAANALYANQLAQTGRLGFVDVAAAAGVAASDQDSAGVCFGDIDNDGDHDLMVLGSIEPNRLFENRGDGTFRDITQTAGVGGGDLSSSSCALGDVDGDGKLDLFVANTHTSWVDQFGIVIPFVFNEHNQLYLNTGGNVFRDVSDSSGIENQAGFPAENAGAASLTWAVAMVDYDLDGDADILTFDDQGVVPHPSIGGLNYGIIHLFDNDGTGVFIDRTLEADLDHPGNWMGVSFGDFDCNGRLDFFATNVGDYPGAVGPAAPYPVGTLSSKWYLQQEGGSFVDPGLGALEATVFGWGTSAFDYDNDGDTDVFFHGGIDAVGFIDASNPGVVLQNQGCTASFSYDAAALAGSADHHRHNGQGLASGDLDGDGFRDLVTVSNFNIPASVPLTPRTNVFGSPFDATAFFVPSVIATNDPTRYLWAPVALENGTLTVERNSGGNGNHGAEVTVRGSVGVATGGRVNRDGIGAVVSFSTEGGGWQMVPILGGSSYASQDSLRANLGLGQATSGTVEVLWPGGVRNRLRGLRSGEKIVFPEIPCDLGDELIDRAGYVECLERALGELVAAGVLDAAARDRFYKSAFVCEQGPEAFCLNNGRFRVEVDWRDFMGRSGAGQTVPFSSDDSGNFWFFKPENWEVLVKVLDGCSANDRFWVFASAATNVEYTLRVTDTQTSVTKTYFKPLGEAAPAITDTQAFASCP